MNLPTGVLGGSSWHELERVVKARFGYKKPFAPRHVEPGEIDKCLGLAAWAPSAHGSEPWRVLAFYKQFPGQQVLRERLVRRMAAEFRRDLLRDGVEPGVAGNIAGASIDTFIAAPVLLLFFLDGAVLHDYPAGDARRGHERVLGIQSVAAFIQTFLLAIYQRGLAGNWYCAPVFAPGTVHDVLHVPSTWEPQAFVTTGYPVDERATPSPAGGVNAGSNNPSSAAGDGGSTNTSTPGNAGRASNGGSATGTTTAGGHPGREGHPGHPRKRAGVEKFRFPGDHFAAGSIDESGNGTSTGTGIENRNVQKFEKRQEE